MDCNTAKLAGRRSPKRSSKCPKDGDGGCLQRFTLVHAAGERASPTICGMLHCCRAVSCGGSVSVALADGRRRRETGPPSHWWLGGEWGTEVGLRDSRRVGGKDWGRTKLFTESMPLKNWASSQKAHGNLDPGSPSFDAVPREPLETQMDQDARCMVSLDQSPTSQTEPANP
jgi:hypothetical protein